MYTLAGMLTILGFFIGAGMIWAGWRDRRDPLRPITVRKRKPISRNAKIRLAAAAVIGTAAWLLTGWAMLLPGAIGLAVVVPKMVGRREAETVIARMEALEDWLRRLVGLLNVGLGLEQAIIETHKTIPKELQVEIGRMISQIQSNKPTREVLQEFADALDDATGDLVCSALMIAAALRSDKLPAALKDFADTVAEEVKGRRQVEVDRRSPRMQARVVSLILIGMLVYLFVGTDYVEPYRRPDMQIVLIGLLTVFAALLAYIARLTRPVKSPRFLRDENAQTTKWWQQFTTTDDTTTAPEGARA